MYTKKDYSTLLEQTKDYALDYLSTVDERPVAPTPAALAELARFEEALPEQGAADEDILCLLHRYGSPATAAQGGGRYFGFVNGGSLPIGLAARWLGDVWDQNSALRVMSPISSTLEDVCEKWLAELLHLPQGTALGLVTGSATANLCGIIAARNALLAHQGWDAGNRGLFGAPPIRVVLSEEAHATVYKALAEAGLGAERVERVATDSEGRLDAAKLPPLDSNTLLILQAASVNSGAFDDFATLCQAGREAGAWIHIDGAFGLWAAASPRFAAMCSGMGLADSWCVDAHKTLNVPYDCGLILCRERAALLEALQMGGAYVTYSEQRDNMRYTLDMSRRARGIELWATLKALGRSGVAALVEQLHDQAIYFADSLREQGFTILNEVCFNQVNVLVGDQSTTDAFLSRLQTSGECWCGGSKRNGTPFVRISVCSHKTGPAEVDRAVAAFVAARQG